MQDIVNEARLRGTPLYPVSTGMNWGLGSRHPVRDDCVLVDLSRMDRIREVDLVHGYAVIDESLENPRCVYQLMKTHFSRYTPEMVNQICGTPKDKFLQVCELIGSTATPDHHQPSAPPTSRTRSSPSPGPVSTRSRWARSTPA